MAKITLTDKDADFQDEIKNNIIDMLDKKELIITEMDLTKKGNRTFITIKAYYDDE